MKILQSQYKHVFALCGISVLALILMLVSLHCESALSRDGTLYIRMICRWHGGTYQDLLSAIPGSDWIPPLYLYLVSSLMKSGLAPDIAARAINIVAACCLPLISYMIAGEFLPRRRMALAAALLTAVNPSLVAMAIQPQREILYLFFAGWCFYWLIRGFRSRKWYCSALAGVFFSPAFLTRYEAVEILPLAFAGLIILSIAKRKYWKQYLLSGVIFCISIVISMYAVANIMGAAEHITQHYRKALPWYMGNAVKIWTAEYKK